MRDTASLNRKRLERVRDAIIKWFEREGRDFVWRQSTDPYHVLIAEMLLRRTTATAVSRVYSDFMVRFNTVERLAGARKTTLMRTLSTLGLQAVRAEQMKQAAKHLLNEHEGTVPRSLTALEALPGVGRYGASAVMNFAFGVPEPMVDGNVVHLMNRVFSLEAEGPSDDSVWDFMRDFGGSQDKRLYWGVIDLVATLCLRKTPRCQLCPLSRFCDFFQTIPK